MSRVAAADVGDDAGKQRQTRMLAQRYREVVATLSPEQVEEFRKVFASFDRDGNGTMNAGELGPAMRSLGHEPTDAELDEMVALVDSDKSVCIDFQEFLTLMALQLHQPFKQSEVMEAFQEFDPHRSGLISVSELREAMTHILPEPMTERELDDMLTDARPNAQGMIDYVQFVKLMFSV